jgi:predicted ester cyclase
VRVLQDAALVLLGLFAGAMLVIGVAFVGYWQSLDPEAFLGWFAANAHRIGDLMIPLGVASTLAAVAAAAGAWRAGGAVRGWSVGSAVLAALVLLVYLGAHAGRNAAFAAHATPPEHVADELAAWARWHWVRVLLGLAAFWAQLVAIRSQAPRDAVSEKNRMLVRELTEHIWNRRRLDLVADYYAPDFVGDYRPYAPLREGHDGIRGMVECAWTAFPDYHEELRELVAEGDRVVARFTISGTQRGQWGPLQPTGKRVEFEEIVILEMRDGKVARQRGIVDNVTALRQLGVLPSARS